MTIFTHFLTFLSGLFYVSVAILLAVAFVEHLRATRRRPIALTHKKRLQQAA